MIPVDGWLPMEQAPRNGDIVRVKFREHNKPDGAVRVAYAQWGCDDKGENWGWRKPLTTGTTQYADAWMPNQDFLVRAQSAVPAANMEFDL